MCGSQTVNSGELQKRPNQHIDGFLFEFDPSDFEVSSEESQSYFGVCDIVVYMMVTLKSEEMVTPRYLVESTDSSMWPILECFILI